MSLSTIVSQYAATNPTVAAAVNSELADSAILTGAQSGDPATSNILAALYSQATESETLLNSVNPVTGASTASAPIGGHVDVQA